MGSTFGSLIGRLLGEPSRAALINSDGYIQGMQATMDRMAAELKEREKSNQKLEEYIRRMNNMSIDGKKEIEQKHHQIEETAKKLEHDRLELQKRQDHFESIKIKRYEKPDQIKKQALIEEALLELGVDSVNEYNIAVTGQTGCGKSSFINAIRGFHDHDEAAAAVGEIETTSTMTKYLHPNVKHIAVWDCPGAGTMSHPLESYFLDKKLYVFDVLIIMFDARIQEVDLDLVRQAMAYQIPVVIARNKADNDFFSRQKYGRRGDKTDLESMKQKLIGDLRESAKRQLAFFIPDEQQPKVFVINSHALLYPDEPQFEEKEFVEHVCRLAYSKRILTDNK